MDKECQEIAAEYSKLLDTVAHLTDSDRSRAALAVAAVAHFFKEEEGAD